MLKYIIFLQKAYQKFTDLLRQNVDINAFQNKPEIYRKIFDSYFDLNYMIDKAQKIYRLFVAKGSTEEINLSQRNRQRIASCFDEYHYAIKDRICSYMFDQAASEIYDIISNGIYPRYLRYLGLRLPKCY